MSENYRKMTQMSEYFSIFKDFFEFPRMQILSYYTCALAHEHPVTLQTAAAL